MKKFFCFILLINLIYIDSVADEGMWLPHLLHSINESDMQNAGLKLTAEDIYNVNSSSLKDAIVSLGGFCTGEMISSNGLMLTNHHCAFDDIQTHSSVENDYLSNGFWAMNKNEELPNEGLTASFLVSIKDVSEKILSEIDSKMSESERSEKIKSLSKKIIEEELGESHYSARVRSFYEGNEFYLLTYETFKDVRLVGAPPNSIGKFGGDTDNWMWPRHTGDFALYRIYADANGMPSEYSEDNIPYSPKHHLPIQLDGVSDGDYSMILGFPGRTNRYLTSFGIKEALQESNPAIVKIRDKKLAVMREYMSADPATNIKYAAKYAQISNYWKYYIGQSKGLRRMNVYEKKLSLENTFRAWVNSGDSIRKKKYGNTLEMIENSYDMNSELNLSRIYLNEGFFRGAEILYFSYMIHNKISALENKEKKEKKAVLEELIVDAKGFYKNYNSNLDESLLASMLEMYYYNIDKSKHPELFSKIETKSKNDFIKRFVYGVDKIDFENYARKVFKNSIFSEEEKCLKFLNNPDIEKLKNDPAYNIINSIYSHYLNTFYSKRKIARENKKIGSRLFLEGLREMNPEKKWYPDANSTLRLTYGTVADYIPGDAMYYNYYTTIDGIMEKEDSTNSEFIVPAKLKELYNIGDYGQYADTSGNLRINFISNNDITGGNSGSPVINAWGELIGTAFDGNWEAMSGDIAFENEIQRTISVDIRYIMFIIDKYAQAKYLIDEMTIAPSRRSSAEQDVLLK